MFVTIISLTLATSSLTLSTLSGSPGADPCALCEGPLNFPRPKIQDSEVIYSKFALQKFLVFHPVYEQLNLNNQVFYLMLTLVLMCLDIRHSRCNLVPKKFLPTKTNVMVQY